MELLDSQQMRLKRLYPGGSYRAATRTITFPLPRVGGGGVGSERVRDIEVLQAVADFLAAMAGKGAGYWRLDQPPRAVAAEAP